MKKVLLSLSVAASLLAISACPPAGKQNESSASAESGEIVAKVGSEVITLKEFEDYINSQNRLVRSRYKSLEQKKRLLQSLVDREAMVLEAKRLGLDKDPKVVEGMKKILARHLVNKVFNGERVKKIQITDAEIEQYYKENESRYHAPEKVRVHHIKIPFTPGDQKSERAAWVKAQKLYTELKSKPNDRRLFIQKARELNPDQKTRSTAGDTGFKSRSEFEQQFGKAVAEAAFSLEKVNDLSKPIKGKDGYYILKQSGRQPAVDLPLERVKEQIRTTLLTRKKAEEYRKFVEELKNKAGVQINEKVLAKAKVDLGKNGNELKTPPKPLVKPLNKIKLPGKAALRGKPLDKPGKGPAANATAGAKK